jgi:hypothetical protein
LRAICVVPPLVCRSLNNILRNRTGGSLQLAAQPLLQNFTDSIKARRGQIPGMKFGKVWRFRASGLEAYIRNLMR